jgi:RND family efflux transporter MFP subunit
MNKKIIYSILAALSVAFILWKIFDNQSKANNEIVKEKNVKQITIETYTIKDHEFQTGFDIATTLESAEISNINTEASGIVKVMNCKLGDKVQKGQILVQIDNEIANQQLQQAVINLDKAKNSYLKYKELKETNNIPTIDFQNIEYEYLSLQRQVAIAKKTVSQTIVRAPISGTIVAKIANKGDLVQEYTPIVSIANVKQLKAIANFNFEDWSNVKVNDKVTLKFNSKIYKNLGLVTKKVPYPTQSNTYPVEITINNPQDLLPGLTVVAQFNQSTTKNLLAIPRSAILIENKETFCYVITKNSITKTRIETGLFDDKFLEIIKGLSENDEVISTGIQNISKTTKVENLIKTTK